MAQGSKGNENSCSRRFRVSTAPVSVLDKLFHVSSRKKTLHHSEVQKMFRSFAINLESQTTEMKKLGRKTPGVGYWISGRMYALLGSFDLGESFSFPKKFT